MPIAGSKVPGTIFRDGFKVVLDLNRHGAAHLISNLQCRECSAETERDSELRSFTLDSNTARRRRVFRI